MMLCVPTIISRIAADTTRPAPLACLLLFGSTAFAGLYALRLERDSHRSLAALKGARTTNKEGEHPLMQDSALPAFAGQWFRTGVLSDDAVIVSIRVVLAEDSFIVREGLEQVLERAPGIEVVAACVDLALCWRQSIRERPDVVVTDIRMPPTADGRGHPRGGRTARDAARGRGGRAEPARRSSLRPGAARVRLRGPRLSAEGAGPRRRHSWPRRSRRSRGAAR